MDIASRVDLPLPAPQRGDERLRAVAEELEATFLAEMLRHAGITDPPEGFGGGAGEDAFAGFLADAYAQELAAAGGIGLAESVFRALIAEDER